MLEKEHGDPRPFSSPDRIFLCSPAQCLENACSEVFLIGGAVNEHWFTSLGDVNPPSDHLLTRGSGFLLIHIDAKQNYLHLNHWCFLESKCYEKVGPLAGSLHESHSVGQRLCPSGWFIHS